MSFSLTKILGCLAVAAAAVSATACSGPQPAHEVQAPQGIGANERLFAADAATVAPPPVGAGFDYQINGAYTPADGVGVVTRDHTAAPAAEKYNICYVNAFQAQPDAQAEWGDLLLRDRNGKVVSDGEWKEALLDIHTADKRERIAEKVNGWIDECAAAGYQAVEPDNFDSYTRSKNLLTDADAQAYIQLLSAHAHEKGLAIGQKNTSELAANRVGNGLDFAVTEQCGEQRNCNEFTDYFGDNVIVIEYTDDGLSYACANFSQLSIVERDLMVVTPTDDEYVRKVC